MAQRGKSLFAQRMKLERESKGNLNFTGTDKLSLDPVKVFGRSS